MMFKGFKLTSWYSMPSFSAKDVFLEDNVLNDITLNEVIVKCHYKLNQRKFLALLDFKQIAL